MKSIFRATVILSASSVVTILLSLVSAKVMALLLLPAAYGYYALLQSFVAVASLIAGLGMATGLVRMGAGAVTSGDESTMVGLRAGAWLLFSGLSVLTMLSLWLFRTQISQLVLGTPDRPGTILLMGVALLFTIAGNIQTGTLNAYHRVDALATYAVANSVVGVLIAIAAVILWRVDGVVPAVIGGAIVTWATSAYLLRQQIGPPQSRPSFQQALQSARSLAAFGGPYTASMLLGTGIQLSLPILVLHLLSAESVGYYKAAAAISVGYLGFLVTAMSQDYYPRVSAAKNQPAVLVELINEQHRLVMLVAAPMILVTLALVPYLVPLVYSQKFMPAVDILEWQLIGDLFKFSSWTMSFAILARCSTRTYFLCEAAGGITTLTTTWFAVRWLGMAGLGISFLITYIIYYAVVWTVTRRELPLVWTTTNKRMMLAAAVGALVIRLLPSTRFAGLRTPVALALGMAAASGSVMVLWQQYITGKEARSAS